MRNVLVRRLGTALLTLGLLTAHAGRAQLVTATVQGTVTDTTGAIVPGATVTVTNNATNTSVSTHAEANGHYLVPSLQPGGPYSISVEVSGYKVFRRSGLMLDVNQQATVDIPLTVGDVSQTVEVTASTPLLSANSATIGQILPTQTIVDLPLNQRNPYALVFLVPGVTGTVGTAFNSANISINGGRPGSTEILIDGIPSSPPLATPINGFAVFPSVESVQEFNIQSNIYTAEYGRSGGGVINLIYKSGTNKFHGSVFEFYRNSAVEADFYSFSGIKAPLPAFARHQYGASIGGPLTLPKLYNGHDKTFFFFTYEGLRQGQGATLTTSVPTAAERLGDFSTSGFTIYNPFTTTGSAATGYTRAAFSGNMIPSSLIDPVGQAFLAYYPLPNQPGNALGYNNYYAQGTQTTNSDQYDAKVDEQINEKNRFFVRYSHRTLITPTPILFPANNALGEGAINELEHDNSAASNYTFAPSSKFLIDVRAGFARIFLNYTPLALGFNPTTLGFPASIASAADHLIFPGFGPANYYTLGDATQGNTRHDSYSTQLYGATFTKLVGNHTLKAGGDLRVLLANVNESGNSTGTYGSNSSYTQGPNPNIASSTSGNSIASFLLGQGTGQIGIRIKNLATESFAYGIFVQDDWKATSRLTLNMGLRWDVDRPRTERANRMETFNPNLPSPFAAQAKLPGLVGGFVYNSPSNRPQDATEFTDFSPRFGFAYAINNKTVLRGGFGMFFAPSYNEAMGTFGQVGFNAITTFSSSPNGLTPTYFLKNPYPTGLNLPTGSSLGAATGAGTSFQSQLYQDTRVPYSENFSLDVQRELPGNILIDAAYVGNHAVQVNKGGGGDYNLNQLTPATLALGSALQTSVANPFVGVITTGPEAAATVPESYLLAPFPQYQAVTIEYPTGGFVLYDALQIKAEQRYRGGSSFLFSFNGQKQIDNYSQVAVIGQSASPQNIYNPLAERAVSANDISRSIVASGRLALPFGRGHRFGAHWSRPLDAIAGGWQLNGIETYHTGFPLALSAANQSASGTTSERPNWTGKNPRLSGPVATRLKQYFDTSQFSQPAPFTFGNTPRVLANVRAPSYHNLDASLFKTEHVTDRLSVELRFESFNVLNQVVFGAPNTSLTSGSFGQITGLGNTPRDLQFGIKILF